MEPFNLAWGASVYAKVVATNGYGDSMMSNAGNGAVIITNPDAPVDLVETVEARTPDSITFSWTNGAANGGSLITSYRVSYDNAVGVFQELEDNIPTTSYTATGLSFGSIYKFKVEAMNGFGYSEYSDEVSILCAAVPVAPVQPTTTVIADSVVFDWDEPVANGTPLTGYKVYIRKSDLSYIIDTTVCNGGNVNVI